jgi:hypothetical protein
MNVHQGERTTDPTNRTLWLCRAYVQVAGRTAWHSWHSRVSLDSLMMQVLREYGGRYNTTVLRLIACGIVRNDSVFNAYIGHGAVCDEDGNRIAFANEGHAEVFLENLCRNL